MGFWYEWTWGLKVVTFLVTWVVAGLIMAWIAGGAAKLGGPEDKN